MTFRRATGAVALLLAVAGCSNGDTESLADLVVIEGRNIQSVEVTSSKDVIAVGEELALTAIEPTSSIDLVGELDWTSSDNAVATVAERGIVTGIADGMVTISGSIGALEASVDLTVSSAVLTGIEVTSSVASVDVCTSTQLTATGTFADGRTSDLTDTVSWLSSDTSFATFDDTTLGQLNSFAVGTVDATASQEGVTSTALPVVISDSLTMITLTAASSTIDIGDTSQLTALGNYGGTDQNIDDAVTFASATTSVATVDDAGLVTGVADGTSVMSASCAGQTGETTLTVSASTATLVDLNAVGSASVSLALGNTLQLEVEAEFSDQSTVDVTEDATWTLATGSGAAVIVSNTTGSKGLLTPQFAGAAFVRAVYEGEEVIFDVQVTPTF